MWKKKLDKFKMWVKPSRIDEQRNVCDFIPAEANSFEVFSIKGNEAYVGFKLGNDFHYVQVPFTDTSYLEELDKLKTENTQIKKEKENIQAIVDTLKVSLDEIEGNLQRILLKAAN